MADALTEYELIFNAYENFNGHSLTIKGWSATVGVASLLAAYAAAPVDRGGRTVVALSTLSVVPFWLTDALWKAIQRGYENYLSDFETAFLKGEVTASPQFINGWKDIGTLDVLVEMTNLAVALPHAPFVLLGIGLAAFLPPNRIRTAARTSEDGPG